MVKDDEKDIENSKYLIQKLGYINFDEKNGCITTIQSIQVDGGKYIYSKSSAGYNLSLTLFEIYEQSTKVWINILDIINMMSGYYYMHKFTKIRINKEEYEKKENSN